MATELEQTQQFFDAVIVIGETGKLFSSLGFAAPALSVLSYIFGLIGSFLPDKKHEEILSRFDALENKLNVIGNDINDLEKMMNWQTVEIQYAQVVNRITHGIEYLNYAIDARNKNDLGGYKAWMNKVSEMCSGQQMTLAIRALKDGLTGRGFFTKDILDAIYIKSGGDRPKLNAMAARLLQLLYSGMMLIISVESYNHGQIAGERYAQIYSRDLREVEIKIKAELQRCVDNFEVNLHEDVKRELQTSSSNADIASRLKNKIESKYDFKEMTVLIYNDVAGSDKHSFGGHVTFVLHENKKCGLVFYKDKRNVCNPQKKYIDLFVSQIAKDNGRYLIASSQYDEMNQKFEENAIGIIGMAFVQRGVDMHRADTKTAVCNIIWHVGSRFTYFVYV